MRPAIALVVLLALVGVALGAGVPAAAAAGSQRGGGPAAGSQQTPSTAAASVAAEFLFRVRKAYGVKPSEESAGELVDAVTAYTGDEAAAGLTGLTAAAAEDDAESEDAAALQQQRPARPPAPAPKQAATKARAQAAPAAPRKAAATPGRQPASAAGGAAKPNKPPVTAKLQRSTGASAVEPEATRLGEDVMFNSLIGGGGSQAKAGGALPGSGSGGARGHVQAPRAGQLPWPLTTHQPTTSLVTPLFELLQQPPPSQPRPYASRFSRGTGRGSMDALDAFTGGSSGHVHGPPHAHSREQPAPYPEPPRAEQRSEPERYPEPPRGREQPPARGDYDAPAPRAPPHQPRERPEPPKAAKRPPPPQPAPPPQGELVLSQPGAGLCLQEYEQSDCIDTPNGGEHYRCVRGICHTRARARAARRGQRPTCSHPARVAPQVARVVLRRLRGRRRRRARRDQQRRRAPLRRRHRVHVGVHALCRAAAGQRDHAADGHRRRALVGARERRAARLLCASPCRAAAAHALNPASDPTARRCARARAARLPGCRPAAAAARWRRGCR